MAIQHFDEKYGSKPPKNYEQFFVPAIGKPVAVDLVDSANLQTGESVLDVACGTGIVARLALEKIGHEGTVAGIDVNAGMLAVAKSLTSNSSIDWYEASAEAMPLPDDSFDVVFCQMGLQFMQEKVVALQEMKRVLKPDGRLLLNLSGPTSGVFSILAEAMKENISPEAAGFVNHVFSLYNKDVLQELFDEAGFQKIDIQATTKELHLPKPKDFLWEYIFSTPLSAFVTESSENSQLSLQRDVIDRWQPYIKNGDMVQEQRIVTVIAEV